jgi:hypothetical protein
MAGLADSHSRIADYRQLKGLAMRNPHTTRPAHVPFAPFLRNSAGSSQVPLDPPKPGQQAAAWKRALKVVSGRSH